MTNAPSKAAIQRAQALIDGEYGNGTKAPATYAFARYIDAHEPQVDPDLTTAREAVARYYEAQGNNEKVAWFRAYKSDHIKDVQVALAAIKLSKERDHDA